VASWIDPKLLRMTAGLAAMAGLAFAGSARPGTASAAPAKMQGARSSAPQFVRDIAPILDRRGCSTAGCHGKFGGRGGFELSLLTLAPADDYEPIVRGARGRRVNLVDPDKSLLLLKATGKLNHAGGERFAPDSADYRTLRSWIAAGAPYDPEKDVRLTGLTVGPTQIFFPKVGAITPLKVVATFSDGSRVDVTRQASYESTDSAVAAVDGTGRITGKRWGGTSVIVRYLGTIRASFVTLPRADATAFPKIVPNNIVDEKVFANLRKLNVHPSRLTTDGEFLRRLSLDLRGKLPEPAEIDAFAKDSAPDKRAKIIDSYLDSPEFVDVRTLRMADLLRVHPRNLGNNITGERTAALFNEWLRDKIEANTPYNQLVRDILLARGSTLHSGPANFYRIDRAAEDRMETVAQAFLGQRMACARCHKHPFDRWTTDDYWNFAAFMGKVGNRGGSIEGEELITYEPGGQVVNQSVTGRRGQVAPPTLLGADEPLAIAAAAPGARSRQQDVVAMFAEWCTSGENTWFAKATVNRLWSHYLGRGVIHPVDDMRATSPVAVPGLLEALADELVTHRYDIKHVIRLIVNSKTYQTAPDSNPTNTLDDRFFSRFYPRPMLGQVFLDVLNQSTGTADRFGDFPPTTRATQLTLPVDSYFMDTFGRSHREFLAELEPKLEPTLVQILHVLNSPYVNAKVAAAGGTVEQLLARKDLDDPGLIAEMYRKTLSRAPTEKETAAALAHFGSSKSRADAAQDLLWALISSREFTFVS